MGKNKSSSSNNNDPLEVINKAVRTLKYPSTATNNNNNNNDDDDTFTKKQQPQHSLNKTLIDKSIRESRIYKPLDVASTNSNNSSKTSKKAAANSNLNDDSSSSSLKVTVEPLDTLAAVVSLSQNENIQNPAVLIFASDTNPGGSKTASNVGTQEEAIVRTSTLSVAQRQLPYPIPDLGIAYVPWVQTILPKEGTFIFGAVCGALRLVMSDVNSGKLTQKEKEYLDAKIMSVLVCAVQNGHDSIVLGSWGGGAFSAGTDEYLRIVAKSFADGIENLMMMNDIGGCSLKRIVFAIPTAAKRKQYEKVILERFA